MKLRSFGRISIALLFAATLAVAGAPGTTASELDTLRAEDHWRMSAPPSTDNNVASPRLHDTYSLAHDTPVQQATSSRQECPTVFSRFCDLISSSNEEQEQDDTVEDANVERSRTEAVSNQVNWQSGSISTLAATAKVEPTRLAVPSLGIDADVTGVGVDIERKMEVPDDLNTVGWYRFGPPPGEDGHAVIAGHLDDHRGRSVFFDLQHVELGAEVSVQLEDGESRVFRVREKVAYDAGNLPSHEIFRREGDPTLALITCGGVWDSSNGRYSETVVVYADPVS
jgi:sortase (surface protein transpeptidase)